MARKPVIQPIDTAQLQSDIAAVGAQIAQTQAASQTYQEQDAQILRQMQQVYGEIAASGKKATDDQKKYLQSLQDAHKSCMDSMARQQDLANKQMALSDALKNEQLVGGTTQAINAVKKAREDLSKTAAKYAAQDALAINDSIKQTQADVKDLSKAYDDLNKAIDSAYKNQLAQIDANQQQGDSLFGNIRHDTPNSFSDLMQTSESSAISAVKDYVQSGNEDILSSCRDTTDRQVELFKELVDQQEDCLDQEVANTLKAKADEVAAAQEAYYAQVKLISGTYDPQIAAVQSQIDAIDQQTQAARRLSEQQQFNTSLAAKQQQLDAETDPARKAKIQADIDKLVADNNAKLADEQRQDQKAALQDQLKTLQKQKSDALQTAQQGYSDQLDALNKYLEDTLDTQNKSYDAQRSALKAAVAQMKSDVIKNQKEITAFLAGDSAAWQSAGFSNGTAYAAGLVSAINQSLSQLQSDAGSLSTGSGVPKMASGGYAAQPTLALIGEGQEPEYVLPTSNLSAMLHLAAWETAMAVTGGQGGAAGSLTNNSDVTQNFNFYQPIQQPSQVAKAVKDLAKEMGRRF